MINKLTIQNLKCFRSLILPLGSFSLLTGFNAAGKSTVLQALLLLAQAEKQPRDSRFVPLNGELVSLGSPGEALSDGQEPILRLSLEFDNYSIRWTLEPDDSESIHGLNLTEIAWRKGSDSWERQRNFSKNAITTILPKGIPPALEDQFSSLADVIYISAVRLGPQDVYPAPRDNMPTWGDVGTKGELAAWWFQNLLDEEIRGSMLHPNEPARTLRRQFNAWAGELFPGVEANAQKLHTTDLVYLEFRKSATDKWRKPANIGYGLTYAFPIIVAGLLAKPGQVLIIDSPEAHLHPMGQSRIAGFLAKVASTGVQVIIETHSDHVLNGARLSVKEKALNPTEVSFHFFQSQAENDKDKEQSQITTPVIDVEGNLSEWPAGFFDQAEADLEKLMGWG